MPIQYITGDLFANLYHAQALAHGCNCQGVMGSGVAVGFRTRYPAMYEEYRRRCKAKPRQFNPGDVFLWKAEDQPWVFNLATQENTWWSKATYATVEHTLAAMQQVAAAEAVTTIAILRIGAGLGGLSWPKVRAIIEQIFANWPGTLYVYEEYVAEVGDSTL